MQSEGLYKVDVDPEQALHALKSGATILLLDVPTGTIVGVDQQAFTVGKKFLGVKMVPPGVHFVSTTSCDSHGGFAPVVGFFLTLGAGDVAIRRWDSCEEILCSMSIDDEVRYQQGVNRLDFDHGLAPYDHASWKQWRGLSKYITKEALEGLMPITGFISIMQEDHKMALTGQTPAEVKLLEQLAEGKPSGQQTEYHKEQIKVHNCFYAELPDLRASRGLVGSELTAIYLDKSTVLAETLRASYSNDDKKLLAEVQFSFLSFVLCQSLQGLNQWKAILQLMLGCEEAFLTRTDLYLKFVKCVRLQLEFGLANVGDMGECWSNNILEESFLKVCLVEFLQRVYEAAQDGNGVDVDLYKECQSVCRLVEEKLGWEVEQQECGEYAPVVVVL